jgi:hypothetical protein
VRAIVVEVLPAKQSLIKPTHHTSTSRAFRSPVDIKSVAAAVGVLAIVVALAVWGISELYTPGPVTRLEVAPPYVDAGPTPPPKMALKATSPRADSSGSSSTPQRIIVPAYTPPPAVQAPAPPRPAGSVIPLAPVARAQRENRLPAPELRFETFEEVSDSAIYGPGDSDVEPPVVMYPRQLGRVPLGVRREDLTYVEVIINEDGRVMQVKAKQSPQTLDESMVINMSLSAAKTWRFRPASKDGRPVKFRQTLPVSLR